MKIAIQTSEIARMLGFVAKKTEQRIYLRGVYIEPREGGGVTLIAIDGHVVGILAVGAAKYEAPFTPFILSITKENTKAIKAGSNSALFSVIDTTEKTFQVFSCPGEPKFENAIIDSQYPDWRRRALPRHARAGTINTRDNGIPFLEASQLEAFKNAHKNAKCKSMRFIPNGTREPIIVTFDGDQNFLGALMPLRPDDAEAETLDKLIPFVERLTAYPPKPPEAE